MIAAIVVAHGIALILSACETNRALETEVIRSAFMAANNQDVETANKYLSKLDRPQLVKTISGSRKPSSPFIDWKRITRHQSISSLAITEKTSVKMTEGRLFEVIIHYETGMGTVQVTVLREDQQLRLTFYKIHLIHHYIDSFRNIEEGGENDSDMIEEAIMSANQGKCSTFENHLSMIDRTQFKIQIENDRSILYGCFECNVLTENRTIERIEVNKIQKWHLTDGNIYEVTLFYKEGIGRVILSTIREKGEWKLTFLNPYLISNYIMLP